MSHYERRVDFVLHLLAQEGTDARVDQQLLVGGRALHRRWVTEVFAAWLVHLRPAEADNRTDLLVVATDLYAWKLLRRDRGLSASATRHRLRQLVDAVLALPSGEPG